MRLVVADTGPILHLHEIGSVHLLDLVGEIVVPRAVETELARLIRAWPEDRPPWLVVTDLEEPAKQEAHRWVQSSLLDPGEAEAISLVQQLHADWLLTDDTGARVVASRLGVEVHGSLGVVLWAVALGHLEHEHARATLEALFRSSLWVSPRLRTEALAALEELLDQ